MRTTVDIPNDLHRQAMSIARDTSRSFSEIVAELMRRGLGQGVDDQSTHQLVTSETTGLPVLRLGRIITTDDVRALEDEQ